MTLLDYIHHVSQTHLAGHLSPKSRPTTPIPSGSVTPVDTEPPVPVTAPTPSESVSDAFVDAPTDPIVTTEPVVEATPTPEPTPVAAEPAPLPVPETIAEEQPVVAEPIALAAPLEAPKPEEVKETEAPIVQPEDGTATEVKPLIDDAHKQPTATHAEMGTLHTAAEPATTVDGTPADKPTEESPSVAFAEPEAEAKDVKKEEKKTATTEKVEKTKAEGKGFFAKFFGSKDKSPKKEKKVKTPKSEQADPTPVSEHPAAAAAAAVAEAPIADAHATESAAETKAEDSTEPKVEITGVAIAAAEPAQVPVHVEEAPVASTSAVVAEAEPVKETETTAAAPVEPIVESKSDEAIAHDKDVKAAKAHRRLSTRFTSFVKNIGKKEHHGKDEHDKDVVAEPSAETSTPVVSDEAPKIAEPTPTEPIQIEEKKPSTTHIAPPVAPVIAATA